MFSGYHPILQSLMGTTLTWGLTALGASLVLVFQGGQVSIKCHEIALTQSSSGICNLILKVSVYMHNYHWFYLQRKVLDGSLGFAAGVRNIQHDNV